jgi:hypothetical protein
MKYYVMHKIFDEYGNPSYARYSMRGYTFNTAKRIAEQVAGYSRGLCVPARLGGTLLCGGVCSMSGRKMRHRDRPKVAAVPVPMGPRELVPGFYGKLERLYMPKRYFCGAVRGWYDQDATLRGILPLHPREDRR